MSNIIYSWEGWAIILAISLSLIILGKLMFVLAGNFILSAQVASSKRNAERAKSLGGALKNIAKIRSKKTVLELSKGLIIQMHNQHPEDLNEFCEQKFTEISSFIYKKIDRYVDVLVDRACYGDYRALKKLIKILASCKKNQKQDLLDDLLARIINDTAIFKIKDSIDNAYDKWVYA